MSYRNLQPSLCALLVVNALTVFAQAEASSTQPPSFYGGSGRLERDGAYDVDLRRLPLSSERAPSATAYGGSWSPPSSVAVTGLIDSTAALSVYDASTPNPTTTYFGTSFRYDFGGFDVVERTYVGDAPERGYVRQIAYEREDVDTHVRVVATFDESGMRSDSTYRRETVIEDTGMRTVTERVRYAYSNDGRIDSSRYERSYAVVELSTSGDTTIRSERSGPSPHAEDLVLDTKQQVVRNAEGLVIYNDYAPYQTNPATGEREVVTTYVTTRTYDDRGRILTLGSSRRQDAGRPAVRLDSLAYRYARDSIIETDFGFDPAGEPTGSSRTVQLLDADGDLIAEKSDFRYDDFAEEPSSVETYTYTSVGEVKYLDSVIWNRWEIGELVFERKFFFHPPAGVSTTTAPPTASQPCTVLNRYGGTIDLTTPVDAEIGVYDYLGRLRWSGRTTAGLARRLAGASLLPPGVYLLQARGTGFACVTKLAR